MNRDIRLHGLSSDHHRALVLARSVDDLAASWTDDDGAVLGRRFDAELEPHFRVEDDVLLPALRRAGAAALADRTAEDHAFLREQIAAARAGDGGAARAFGQRLGAHVRFEERELFPACEELLPAKVLDEILRVSPKRR